MKLLDYNMYNVEIVNKSNTIKHIMTNDVDFTNQNLSIYMQIKLIHNRLKNTFLTTLEVLK